MANTHIIDVFQNMLLYTLSAVCIMTVPMLIVGILFSVFQSATQINEMTITFIPKLIVMFVLLYTLAPWLMGKLVVITQDMLMHVKYYIR